MTPGTIFIYFSSVKRLTCRVVDTYTAQATVGDINKGITNHKVRLEYVYINEFELSFSF